MAVESETEPKGGFELYRRKNRSTVSLQNTRNYFVTCGGLTPEDRLFATQYLTAHDKLSVVFRVQSAIKRGAANPERSDSR